MLNTPQFWHEKFIRDFGFTIVINYWNDKQWTTLKITEQEFINKLKLCTLIQKTNLENELFKK